MKRGKSRRKRERVELVASFFSLRFASSFSVFGAVAEKERMGWRVPEERAGWKGVSRIRTRGLILKGGFLRMDACSLLWEGRI